MRGSKTLIHTADVDMETGEIKKRRQSRAGFRAQVRASWLCCCLEIKQRSSETGGGNRQLYN
jgi:hypothetical protein